MANEKPKGKKAYKLIELRNQIEELYRHGYLHEDEQEELEAPINKILEDMGIRRFSEDF